MNHDGVDYVVYTALYNQPLAPGQETSNIVNSLRLNEWVDITLEGFFKDENEVGADYNPNKEAYWAYHDQWLENGVEWGEVPNILYVYNDGDLHAAQGFVNLQSASGLVDIRHTTVVGKGYVIRSVASDGTAVFNLYGGNYEIERNGKGNKCVALLRGNGYTVSFNDGAEFNTNFDLNADDDGALVEYSDGGNDAGNNIVF